MMGQRRRMEDGENRRESSRQPDKKSVKRDEGFDRRGDGGIGERVKIS
jgi:hypothetical protein